MRCVSFHFDRWTFLFDSGEPFERPFVCQSRIGSLRSPRSPNLRGRYGCPVAQIGIADTETHGALGPLVLLLLEGMAPSAELALKGSIERSRI
jgi:hypothetical protein